MGSPDSRFETSPYLRHLQGLPLRDALKLLSSFSDEVRKCEQLLWFARDYPGLARWAVRELIQQPHSDALWLAVQLVLGDRGGYVIPQDEVNSVAVATLTVPWKTGFTPAYRLYLAGRISPELYNGLEEARKNNDAVEI